MGIATRLIVCRLLIAFAGNAFLGLGSGVSLLLVGIIRTTALLLAAATAEYSG